MYFCTSNPNLVILARAGDELLCGQARHEVHFDFKVKVDLWGQGQSPVKAIGILTNVFCTSVPNVVILAWMGHKLSRRQAQGWHTD